jgi:hypothetical protein
LRCSTAKLSAPANYFSFVAFDVFNIYRASSQMTSNKGFNTYNMEAFSSKSTRLQMVPRLPYDARGRTSLH